MGILRRLRTTAAENIARQVLMGVFLFATLATAVYSVEKVVWVDPQPRLLLILLLAVISTFLLFNSKLPGPVKYLAMISVGTAVFIWQISELVSPQPWWQALKVQPNHTTIYFSAFLIFSTWVIGCISSWYLIKRQNAWVAIVLAVGVILINLNNLTDKNYYQFFQVFVLASVLLLGYTHLISQFNQLKLCSQTYSKSGVVLYSVIVIIFGLLVSFSSRLLPEIKLDSQKSIANKISVNVSREQWFNIFADVNEKAYAAPAGKQKNTEIRFSDPPAEDKAVIFEVNSANIQYLRIRRYDGYLSTGWTSNTTVDNTFNPQESVLPANYLHRIEQTYSIVNKMPTDTLLVTGELKTLSIPVVVQTMPTRPSPGIDIISITATKDILPDETYSVTSWVSQATAAELYRSGTDYPDWVKERYLQLPPTVTDRVKALSLHLTEGAQTPYEKAQNIKNFLQRFTYNIVFNSPPNGMDGIDYFLFERKAGDCTYFASSMAVMLRSVGVPARISSGFRLLERDPVTGMSLARGRDYHARTEVYFPGYGWIEYEVTPGLPGMTTADVYVNMDELLAVPNVTRNVTFNTTERVKLNYVNYDEEGNLLDEFGNPIYQNAVNPGAMPPNMNPAAPNLTANASANATLPAHNATGNATNNITANRSANVTKPAANVTRPATPNTTQNHSSNVSPAQVKENPGSGLDGGGNRFQVPQLLIKLGQISIAGFILGLLFIMLYQLWLNSLKRTRDARTVYSKMCRLASLSKSGPKAFETPSEYGQRLGTILQGQGQSVEGITRMYGESRFGRTKILTSSGLKELEQSWVQVYPVLIKRIFNFK